MQTLTELAKKVMRWERYSLLQGAYRLQNIAMVELLPIDLFGFTDCSYDAQFTDELIAVKKLFGVEGGIWLGFFTNSGTYVEVVSLLME